MEKRIQQLLVKMKEADLDAILIGSKANRMYLSGFTGSSALLYISPKRQVIITDFRYMEQVQSQCPHFESKNQGTLGLYRTAFEIAKSESVKKIGFEAQHTSYSIYTGFEAQKAFQFIPVQDMVEKLRQLKDEDELKKIEQAEAIGDMAFKNIVSYIDQNWKKGLTENEVALEIERVMRQNGASGTSFDSIVASGAKSSLPHAVPCNVPLQEKGFVVMDFGCIYEGYCSDMTRTIMIGEPSKEQLKIYEIVLKAQLEALKGIKPGMKGKEVDAIARQIIKDEGYGDYFGHGLGHSVGLEIHESPRFSVAEDAVIEENMIMTVEPGIYVPHLGGVRIEDLVCVTKTGIRNFTHSPKELIIIR